MQPRSMLLPTWRDNLLVAEPPCPFPAVLCAQGGGNVALQLPTQISPLARTPLAYEL